MALYRNIESSGKPAIGEHAGDLEVVGIAVIPARGHDDGLVR
jgi:hypothetical protein